MCVCAVSTVQTCLGVVAVFLILDFLRTGVRLDGNAATL